jgi:hypothetical protein
MDLSMSVAGGADTYGLEDINLGPSTDLGPTWWVIDREPGMDDLAGTAGDILQKMKDDLKIFPFQDRDGNDRLFLARFEFPKYKEAFQFSEALFISENVVGWIDFLAGFQVDCIEMLVAIGEFSTKADKVIVMDGTDKAAAPVPEKFFKWPDESKILLNLTAIPTKDRAKILAPNLDGEPKPTKPHWWFRGNLVGDTSKFPIPGEFVGLGVRMMPNVAWGKQKSSPFVYSGNWMDTVYYTSAVITVVFPPTDTVPYSTYKVKWRKYEITVNPSDFAEYRVGDRVTILKDVSTDKTTQLWKDDDTQNAGENWQIVPITFYGLEREA